LIWLIGVVETRTGTSFRYASGLIRCNLQDLINVLCGAPNNLIEACKINGVEPYAYLKDVLTRIWTHPQSQIDLLMPRLWKPPPDDP
jgi:hypothetical protein